MIKISQSFILAAGLGTRMGKLTKNSPKPLLRYKKKAMIDYIIDAFEAYGIEKIIVNIHAFADKMSAHLKEHKIYNKIIISDESDKLRGTGGALTYAYKKRFLSPSPFFIHNCDVFFSSNKQAWAGILSALNDEWNYRDMDGLLLLKPKLKNGAGDFSLDRNGKIIIGNDYIYTGVQILSPSLLVENIVEMEQLWHQAQSKSRLFGKVLDKNWQHLGTAAEFEAVK